jgi:hypothetical protein
LCVFVPGGAAIHASKQGCTLELDLAYNLSVSKPSGTVIGVAVMLLVGLAVLGLTIAKPRTTDPEPVPAGARPVVRGANAEILVREPHLLMTRAKVGGAGGEIEIAPLGDPAAARATTALKCDRISFAGGRGICLQTALGVLTKYEAVVFDSQFKPILTMKLDGTPTRTRISPDGRYGATTVFVTGQEHGYNSVSFSTKTTLIEMASGKTLIDLEQFKVVRDGQPFAAKDFNFWGVTFARDSNIFYASLMTDRKTYLVRGEVATRSMTVLRENVECPSLSPDNQLIAYKKRVGGDLAPWRFYVMDLATMAERPIAGETRSIDDQLEWLDDRRVLYATTRSSQSGVTDVWVADVSGAEPARQLLLEGESPIVVR